MQRVVAVPARENSYWASLARCFQTLAAPLRPSPEDIRVLEATIAGWASTHPTKRTRALSLGVTPEIATMRWPEGWSLLAADSSLAMACAVWPGDIPGRRRAVCANWLELPVNDDSCGIVTGDGSANCLPYPHGFRELARSVYRILTGDGLFLVRAYIQPDNRERLDDVFAEIRSIPTFHLFKFRLLMAMQQSVEAGIPVRDVYQAWADRNLSPELLDSRPGWHKPATDMIELYRDSDTVHTFPTLAEFRSAISEFFEEISMTPGDYVLGERCPIFALRPRGK